MPVTLRASFIQRSRSPAAGEPLSLGGKIEGTDVCDLPKGIISMQAQPTAATRCFVIASLVLVSLLFVGPLSGWLVGLLAAVGLILVVTGAAGTCPIFTALGVSTRRAGTSES